MNTCETCKYWNRDYKIVKGVSDCDRLNCLPDLPNNTMLRIDTFVHDDSGLDTVLMTGKDFGCVHYTGKT